MRYHLTAHKDSAASKSPLITKRHRLGMHQREAIVGYLFVSPVILGLLIFTMVPLLSALYYSFTNYDLFNNAAWVGIANYQKLWHDPLWFKSLEVTFIYAFVSVPLGIIGSLGLALLLTQDVPGTRLWRAIFYLPVVFPIVASSIIWGTMFNAQGGLLNYILVHLHLPAYTWTQEPETALPSLIIFSLWGIGGSMLIWISGLNSVPVQLLEAAKIDGANTWQRFFNITLPMLSPVIFFNVIIGVIGSLQTFAQAQVITAGGPLHATFFIVLFIYQEAFQNFHMGYASAIAWMLFAIIGAFTLLLFRTSGWVYYQGGDR